MYNLTKIRTFSERSGLLFMAIVMLAITFSSCDDNATSSTKSEPEPQGDLYAIFWRVDSPDGRTNYVSLVNDLMTGEVDPSEALEVSGQSRFLAPRDAGYFIIGNGEELTFTRYNITDGGTEFKEGGKFSLSSEGVTSLQKRTVFLSDTKAYYIDNTQGQIVIFNPEEMTITGSFNLPEEFADGYKGFTTQLGFGKYQLNGNRLSIPVGWVNFDANTNLDKTGLAIVNTESDQVINYSEDNRCPLAVSPAFMENGDVYYGVSERYHFSTAAREKEDAGCILKKAAGTDTFDQGYDPYMMEQIEGKKVGLGLGNAPKENYGYFRVLNTDVLEWSADVEAIDYYDLVWDTYEINLPENKVTGKVDRPLAPSFFSTLYEFDDGAYGTIKINNDEKHRVVKYAPDGSYQEGISTPGYISNMQQIIISKAQ